jgi:hypothetical protein
MLTRRPRSCSDEGSYTSGHHHHHRACSVYRSAVRRPAGASILPSASSLGSSCGLRGPAAPASSPYDTMRGAASSRASVHGRGGTERGGRRRARIRRPPAAAPLSPPRPAHAPPPPVRTRPPARRGLPSVPQPEHLVIASRFVVVSSASAPEPAACIHPPHGGTARRGARGSRSGTHLPLGTRTPTARAWLLFT